MEVDLCVIGSGPGGYVAAIRAAQLGLKTVCVEKESLGGVCLNWGCIPTKALLRSAEVYELCKRSSEFGIMTENVAFDFGSIIKRSRDITKQISKGVAYLFRKNKVTHVQGTAKLKGAGIVEVTSDKGVEKITAKHVILATGARARSLPNVDFDGEHILSYREAMTLKERPKSLIVLGAGAIGVEFASFYSSLGTDVTIIEYQPRLVPNEDKDISEELERAFVKHGVQCMTGHGVQSATAYQGKVSVSVEAAGGGSPKTFEAEKCLVAIGVAGNIEGLGLEEIGVSTYRGQIVVNDYLETDVRGVYAIGDVTGGFALAHVASAEGVFAAETIAGHSPTPIPYHAIPGCTYCHPEIASVGLTEEQAKDKDIPIKVGKFPFGPLGRTVAAGEYPGLCKFIWDERDNSLVGAHMIGPAVTDLIAAPTLGKSTEVNAESFIDGTIWAHPTFAEALKEAAEDAFGKAIHI